MEFKMDSRGRRWWLSIVNPRPTSAVSPLVCNTDLSLLSFPSGEKTLQSPVESAPQIYRKKWIPVAQVVYCGRPRHILPSCLFQEKVAAQLWEGLRTLGSCQCSQGVPQQQSLSAQVTPFLGQPTCGNWVGHGATLIDNIHSKALSLLGHQSLFGLYHISASPLAQSYFILLSWVLIPDEHLTPSLHFSICFWRTQTGTPTTMFKSRFRGKDISWYVKIYSGLLFLWHKAVIIFPYKPFNVCMNL